jgi:hypothetical protein
MEEVRKLAAAEGVALNQLINVAVAEKVSALRTEEYFRVRSARANRAQTMRILARAGRDNEPISGDELPDEVSVATLKTKGKQPPASSKRPRERVQERKRPATSESERRAKT